MRAGLGAGSMWGVSGRGGSELSSVRARRASLALVVIGTIMLALGGPLFYLRANVFGSERFAARATSALDSADARQAISRQIVTLAVEQTPVPVAAARPLLEETVAGALDSPPFRSLFRGAAEQAHRVLFERGKGAVAFTLADTGIALIGALKAVAPALAKQVPPDISVALVHFNRHGLGLRLVGLGYNVRLLGILLPILGLLCWIAAIALPGERRRVAGRIGCGLAIAGVLSTSRSWPVGRSCWAPSPIPRSTRWRAPSGTRSSRASGPTR